MAIGQLDHIAFSVADFDAQVEWYKRAFDMHEGEGERVYTEEPYTRAVLLMSSDEGLCVELAERAGSTRPPSSGPAPLDGVLDQGFHHWTLRVDDIDAVFDQLITAGATSLGFRADHPRIGVRIALLADPEGNRIELLQPVPVQGPAPSPGGLAAMRHRQAIQMQSATA